MNCFKCISTGTFLLASLLFSGSTLAAHVMTSQEFIDIAAVRSISEVETAKIALSKSVAPEVKAYAQAVIVEQSAELDSLRALAKAQHLQMFSEAELQDKARTYIFQRNGKAFDPAYAEMRALERRKAVSLFRSAAELDDVAIKQFAISALPVLMRSLYMAQTLTEHLGNTGMLADNNM